MGGVHPQIAREPAGAPRRGPSVDCVFDKTSRHARTSDRLARLHDQAQQVETPELSPTQDWVDDSIPDVTAPVRPWWQRLGERWTSALRQRRIALAVAGVVVGMAVAVGVALAGSGPTAEPPPALPAAEPVPSAAASSRAGESIVVSVVGLVAKPGLVTLPDGARIADALRASGGPVAGTDLSALNLARRLTDGEQIYVGVPAPPGQDPAGPAGDRDASSTVDLNTAELDALDTLPGVGPVTAQRILDWRTEHGRFTTVDQLREIDGIGPTRFEKLKDLVVVR